MYLRSRTSAFAAAYRQDLVTLLARAEVTVFIAGSCGLELLLNLHLTASELQCIRVIALGPVARGRPNCETILVQGRGDWLSRYFFDEADYRVECGHIGYLQSSEVLGLCRHHIGEVQQHRPAALREKS
ncbi:hypothetical protein PHO31112_05351 [Pandoraea horticolens]|uniref:Alpha/beta hydrolase n=1 Tax=Pandoraea horticolens TaxID=2508298 RepID=A0A5E4ZBI3_9BURK|nr:hypothetical protein [Pandoraea horticolens]VVE58619.1 hypothetical protein PHO31112_05351 [Pandoraea horticolens]